ncbi:MAG: hypothetical protein GX493_00120 [Firmicutes bacterium]|nr:hypothetical protein [Bacillota bacterium]
MAVLWEGNAPWLSAFGYLLLYNLLFIAPLFLLILLVRLGVTSARLAEMARRQAGKVRFLLALFWIILWMGTR